MTTELQIITNNVPRDVLDAYSITMAERAEFNYYDWDDIEAAMESASFFRYKGELYDLSEFEVWDNPASPTRNGWDGIRTDSFFSGLVVRYCNNYEQVIVGRYYS